MMRVLEMRILVAPDKFKGSLTAAQAAEAMRVGLAEVFPEAEFSLLPMADGGEGTSELLREVFGGETVSCSSEDALGRPIEAEYAWVPDRKLAILDMSAAAGLWRLTNLERDPLQATTTGVGRMMRDAIERGAEQLWVGLGGSATNDAGCGMGAALGWRFLDENREALPPSPAGLSQLARVEPPAEPLSVHITVLSDVGNPLLGESGCSRVFAPQKGATPDQVEDLEAILEHVCDVVCDVSPVAGMEVAGDGAAGGIGWGLRVFCGAETRSGFAVISEAADLPRLIAEADLVVTGEGKLDAQSLSGKAPVGVARMAREAGKPVIALVGALDHAPELFDVFHGIVPLATGSLSEAESFSKAAVHLEAAAFRAGQLLRAGSRLNIL